MQVVWGYEMTPRPSLTRAARPPKFRIGQVVLMRCEAFVAYRISKVYPQGMMIHKEPYYLFEGLGKWGSCESNLRPLTKRERGQ